MGRPSKAEGRRSKQSSQIHSEKIVIEWFFNGLFYLRCSIIMIPIQRSLYDINLNENQSISGFKDAAREDSLGFSLN